MKTTFTEAFNYDFAVLDIFGSICDLVLFGSDTKEYNIYDRQNETFVFENDLATSEFLEIWVERAYKYFKEEYIENINTWVDQENFDRQKLYLSELELIKKYYFGE